MLQMKAILDKAMTSTAWLNPTEIHRDRLLRFFMLKKESTVERFLAVVEQFFFGDITENGLRYIIQRKRPTFTIAHSLQALK